MTRRLALLKVITVVVLCTLLLGSVAFAVTYTARDAQMAFTFSPIATPTLVSHSPLATPALVMLSPIATHTPTVRREASMLLDQLRQEIIPAEGADAGYGASFTVAGYNSLLAWNRDVKLREGRQHDFAGLHVRLPCCAFADTVEDETQNCACGHHVALYGAAKKLLAEGWERAAVQQEINRWARYFFPKEALVSELVRRAAFDPEMSQALEELKAKGGC